MPNIRLYRPLILLAVFHLGCQKEESKESAPIRIPAISLFAPDSPFNTPIPKDAAVDPSSDVMIESLVEDAKSKGFFIALKSFSETVYFAGANTMRYDVVLTASWAPRHKLLQVPIPEYALADPSTDGEMLIIDTLNACEYDFWQARKINGHWFASWGNALPADGNGIYEKGMSARGSGFALSAGIIWPDELKKHAIHHALVFTYDFTKSGGPVYPATESDGASNSPKAIPEGARLQLNPELDLSTLGLNTYEMTIAKALQTYGMYLCDDGGGVELEAVNPLSFSGNMYEGLLPDSDYVSITHIPPEEFRVLLLPPQNSASEPEIVQNGCAVFR